MKLMFLETSVNQSAQERSGVLAAELTSVTEGEPQCLYRFVAEFSSNSPSCDSIRGSSRRDGHSSRHRHREVGRRRLGGSRGRGRGPISTSTHLR